MRCLFLPRCFAFLLASYRSLSAFFMANLHMIKSQNLRTVHPWCLPSQLSLSSSFNHSVLTTNLFSLPILENSPAIYWILPPPGSCLRNHLPSGSIVKIVADFLKPLIWEAIQTLKLLTLFSPSLSALLYHLCDLDPQLFGCATQIHHLVHLHFCPLVRSSELVR